MTIGEMVNLWKLKLDKIDSFQFPRFTDSEIESIFMDSIRRFIKTRYSGSNQKNSGFEQSQKRIEDLSLCKNNSITDLSLVPFDTTSQRYEVTKPDEYWFYISSLLMYDTKKCYDKTVKTYRYAPKVFTHNEIFYNLDNDFTKPSPERPELLFSKDKVYVYTGESITTSAYSNVYFVLEFIDKPLPFTLSTPTAPYGSIPEHAHDEIVNMAVASALEYIEQERLKSFLGVDYASSE